MAIPNSTMSDQLKSVPGSAPADPRSFTTRELLWNGFFGLVVVLTTLVSYWPSLSNDFVNWDDPIFIVENPHIRSLNPEAIQWMFSSFRNGPYQPIPWLSYAIDFSIWGLDPRGYHLSNLIWHVLTALVFYLTTRRLLQLSHGEKPGRSLHVEVCAALSAVFFAVHPLRVESVAWASERRDAVAGFFALCSVAIYLRGTQSTMSKRAYRAWTVASLIFFALALLSKATTVALPAVLTVLDIYPLKRLGWNNRSIFSKQLRGVWFEKIPFWVMSILAGATAIYGQRSAGGMVPLERFGVIDRLSLACFSAAFYVWKTLVPLNLSPMYEIPFHFNPWQAKYLLPAATSLAVLVWLARYHRRFPGTAAAAACFLLFLAPVSGLAQTGGQLAADRYTYLSCLGFAVLLGGAVLGFSTDDRLHTWRPGTQGLSKILPVFLLVVAGLTLGAMTWRQSKVWRNTETLWRHALAVDTSSHFALNSLGKALIENGSLEQAQSLFLRVLSNHPDNPDAHNNMGIVLRRMGEPCTAFRHYLRAMELRPNSVDTAYNVGLLLTEEGLLGELGFSSLQEQWQAATVWYQRVLAIKPDYVKALNGLGIASKRLGQLDEAVALYERALRIDPTYFDAEYNLAIALAEQGDEDESLLHYNKVLSLKPDHVGASNNLALLLERRGQFVEAVRILRAGLARSPDHKTLLYHLSWLLATAPDAGCRNGPDAVALAERLVQVAEGKSPEALDALAAAYAEVGRFEEAIQTSTLAAQLAREQEKPDLADQIEERIQTYQTGKPFRVSPH